VKGESYDKKIEKRVFDTSGEPVVPEDKKPKA